MKRDETLAKATYVSFSTLRKNGNWVDTPVWFAPDGDVFYIFSAGNAGKVKRLRNFSQCRVAPSTYNGTPTGEYRSGEAWLVNEEAEMRKALQALRRKYGWQMRVTDLGARLSGRFNRRQYIGVRLLESAADGN